MSGKAIGIVLNSMPELVWQGHVKIEKVAGEFKVRVQFMEGDPSADAVIREYISKAIAELRDRV